MYIIDIKEVSEVRAFIREVSEAGEYIINYRSLKVRAVFREAFEANILILPLNQLE